MEKIYNFLIIIGIFFLLAKPVSAENIAGNSAVFNSNDTLAKNEYTKYSQAKRSIKKILEKYNSPLQNATDNFISTCQKYQLDCYLLPAIAGLESTFGKFIYPNSFNPFGWGGGYIMFDSWEQAIDAVGKGLRENYIDKGAINIEQIGRIYSESPTWSARVGFLINLFQKQEENQLLFSENGVKL